MITLTFGQVLIASKIFGKTISVVRTATAPQSRIWRCISSDFCLFYGILEILLQGVKMEAIPLPAPPFTAAPIMKARKCQVFWVAIATTSPF